MKKIHYNRANACDNCGNKLGPHYAYREYDKEGNWTGRWLCKKCYMMYNYNIRPYSRRNENLSPNSPQAKGDKFELLTCIWRRVDSLNIKNDNYTLPIDHSKDLKLGIIQTKGRLYNPISERWVISSLYREWFKEFDYLIFYCADKDGEIIERIYIIPKEEIIKRNSIGIYKNNSRGPGWYEKYRVTDEETIKKVKYMEKNTWSGMSNREEF